MPARASRARDAAVMALVVLATGAMLLALVIGYVRRAAIDADQFANRATAALRDPAVRTLVADRVTDELILARKGDLLAARPLIASVVADVVGGRAFTAAFRAGVRDVHRAVLERDQDTVTLTVADVGTVVAAALDVVRPALARRVRLEERLEVVRRDVGSATAAAVRTADAVEVLAPLLLLVAVLCAAGAIGLATDRRRTVVRLGIGAVVAGVLVLVGCEVGRMLAARAVEGPEARDAARAIWDAFLGDLRTAGLVLAACGAIVAAASASILRPVALGAPLARVAARLAREPERPVWRVLRGAALVALGLACLLARDVVIRVLSAGAGLLLVFAGSTAVLRVVHQPRVTGAADHGAATPGRRARWIVAVLAAVLVAGTVAAFVASGGTTTAAPALGACNGHVALCDRTLPEVALAATHNSMSVPLPGWYSSAQDAPIADQLAFGVRGLLIDTHYADRLPSGRLRTDVGDREELLADARSDGVSPEAVDAALRLRGRIGFSGRGERGMYLCHSFCELGGTPLEAALADLHDFAVANPGEVFVVINQDYVAPADFVRAVEDAGLAELAFPGPVDGRWPTLREMVDRGQRILFLAENRAGAAPWYRPAYASLVQETPFAFSRPRELTARSGLARTCEPNRGPASAPLFLVNHWITTDPVPLPSQADRVNAYRPLMRRLDECRRLRDHLPNLVAVNFYRRGDLLRAVDTLNGVGR